MEKDFAATEERIPAGHERPELGAAQELPSKRDKEKARGDHNLNVYISFELKERLLALAEKHDLTMADMVRQLIKAGLPVFESLSATQEELLSGFIRLLRKGRSISELKK